MRSSPLIVLSLAAALVATGCKKASDSKSEGAPAAGKTATGPATPPADPAAKPATPTGPATPPTDPAAPPVGTETTLKLTVKAAPKVGDKRGKTDDINTTMVVDANGKPTTVIMGEHKEQQAEVLAVDGDVRTKIKITYVKLTATQTIGTAVKSKPQPLDGKTYIVAFEGGEIKSTTPEGAAVSPEEAAELADDNDELGQPDVMEKILADHTWTIGETYAFSADELARLAARKRGPGKPTATAMGLTLKSFDAKHAEFAITTTLTRDKDQFSVTMTGTIVVDRVNDRPLSMTMEGALTATTNGKPTTGTLIGKTVYTY